MQRTQHITILGLNIFQLSMTSCYEDGYIIHGKHQDKKTEFIIERVYVYLSIGSGSKGRNFSQLGYTDSWMQGRYIPLWQWNTGMYYAKYYLGGWGRGGKKREEENSENCITKGVSITL